MTKDEIVKKCIEVRSALEQAAKENILPDEMFHYFPEGQCLITSEVLAMWLPRNNNDCFEIVSGWYGRKSHAWLEYNGFIIDITADQFPEIDEKIIVTTDSSFHNRFNEDRKRRVMGKSSYNYSVNELFRFLSENT